LCVSEPNRNPERGSLPVWHPARRKFKTRRHDADNGVRQSVECDGLAEDCGIATEMPLPQRVAQNGDKVAGRIFVPRECAAKKRTRAERGKEIRRDACSRNALRLARSGEV